MGDLYDSKCRRRTRGRTTGENEKVKETTTIIIGRRLTQNISISTNDPLYDETVL